jgi:DUF971 family protein
MTAGWPVELRYRKAARVLEIDLDSGETLALPAEYLRVESPSAEVKGHGSGQRIWVAGKRDVAITAIEPVGNYAVRIRFDDGHDTGLYAFDYLRRLATEAPRLWTQYRAALARLGKSRDTQ